MPLIATLAAAGLPTDALSSCAYDAATVTVHVQMLSPRTAIARAGDRVRVDGHDCGPAAARQIVVASAFPETTDAVVVDERHGRLPEVFALTGPGGDTIEVIGTAGPDRYTAHDDLGASIDLDGDGAPDVVSTDAGRVVLRGGGGDDRLDASPAGNDRLTVPVRLLGGPGDDRLRGGRSGADRIDGGAGNDRVLGRGAAGDRLAGGRGFDAVRADAGDVTTGFERR